MTVTTLVQLKECDVCRQVIRIWTDPETGREVAFDEPSGFDHECFQIPQEAELLVMDEPSDENDCNCLH